MDGTGGGGEQQTPSSPRLGRTPKEGERILAPTRRPDGTLRKPIRIRAGYVPQDEVAIYQSKGALLKKSSQLEVPPGYDPVLDAKPKTKSAKRNERKKEKKLQTSLAKSDGTGKSLESREDEKVNAQADSSTDPEKQRPEPVELALSKLNKLSVSATHSVAPPEQQESSSPSTPPAVDLDKKIRALKKKIRLAEGQQKGSEQNLKHEQLEKQAKIRGWREELKLLEDKKSSLAS